MHVTPLVPKIALGAAAVGTVAAPAIGGAVIGAKAANPTPGHDTDYQAVLGLLGDVALAVAGVGVLAVNVNLRGGENSALKTLGAAGVVGGIVGAYSTLGGVFYGSAQKADHALPRPQTGASIP